jgi:hypothetical protein
MPCRTPAAETCPAPTLAAGQQAGDPDGLKPAIDHEGVLFIMELIGDIRNAVEDIRDLLRGDDGEEEEEDEDA